MLTAEPSAGSYSEVAVQKVRLAQRRHVVDIPKEAELTQGKYLLKSKVCHEMSCLFTLSLLPGTGVGVTPALQHHVAIPHHVCHGLFLPWFAGSSGWFFHGFIPAVAMSHILGRTVPVAASATPDQRQHERTYLKRQNPDNSVLRQSQFPTEPDE